MLGLGGGGGGGGAGGGVVGPVGRGTKSPVPTSVVVNNAVCPRSGGVNGPISNGRIPNVVSGDRIIRAPYIHYA